VKRILVTGGAGFIGSHLCERLLADGAEVAVIDDFNPFYDPAVKRRNAALLARRAGFRLVEGDIRDRDAVERLFSEGRFDAVIHLAAMAGVRPSLADPLLYADVNVSGTIVLLEAACRHGNPRFLFGSSSSVYGATSRVPFREDDPADRPVSPYAATKRAGELLSHNYHHVRGLDVVCLRFFTVYGPRQRPEMAIHKFARAIDRGETVPIFGDGASRRDYTYVSDIVDGVARAMAAPAGFHVYNLGESRTVGLLEMVRLLERALGKPAKLEHRPDQPGDVKVTFADVSLARTELGYDPKVPVEEGIGRFVEWFRAEARGRGNA